MSKKHGVHAIRSLVLSLYCIFTKKKYGCNETDMVHIYVRYIYGNKYLMNEF